jgi:predicted flavoprotein YhiN
VALSFGGETVRGEATVTKDGIEGGAIYALSAPLREAVLADGTATPHIALRPDLSAAELEQRLAAPRGKQSLSNFLRKAVYLEPVAIGLLQEAAAQDSVRLGDLGSQEIAERINDVPVTLSGVAPVESAISTAGGIDFSELDSNFMLKRRPGVFAAGEMLDWEAPTGGYLLQACFATGAAAGRGASKWLAEKKV